MAKKRWKFLSIRIAAALLAAAVSAFPGCLPSRGDRAGGRPAPGANVIDPGADYAHHRAKYLRNRMVPPEHYSVMQHPARNNEFGEFDDGLYGGLDSQPALPPLPGDAAAMPAFGGADTYAMAAGSPPGARTGTAPYPATRAPAGPRGTAPQGVATETHFYPVEQLVFGGDNGELDSPDVYRLMPRDVIGVTVRDHPEFSGTLTLQADGTVRVPNTPDPVRLRGLTADEAADAIRRSIAVYVRGDCVVRVQTNRARGGYYFVFGDVRQPGRFPMGLEPVTLSDAVMAANFEANPNRLDESEELGPAFPTASPLGSFITPRTADMARVMLITPHRSQPSRTTHDLRQAMLGMTGGNPPVRPGQIIIVPSLDPEKNLSLGLAMAERPTVPEGLRPGQGFSTANSPARLPEALPYADASGRDASAGRDAPARRLLSDVEANLSRAYGVHSTVEPTRMEEFPEAEEYAGGFIHDGTVYDENGYEILPGETIVAVEAPRSGAVVVESVNPALPESGAVVYESAPPARGRRLRKAPFAAAPEAEGSTRRADSVDGWEKGF